MKPITLLGASGFVGKEILRQWARVAPLLELSSPDKRAEVILDVCGPGDPRRFNDLQSVSSHLNYWTSRMESALDDAAPGATIIHLSTMDLNFPPVKPQLYLVYKTLQRDFLRVWAETRDLTLRIVETSCVYGLDIAPSRFLYHATQAAIEGKPITLFCKNGKPSERPWTAVTQLASVLLALAEKPDQNEAPESIQQFYSFTADVEWIATRIREIVESQSEIRRENFYNKPISDTHIFSVHPVGFGNISSSDERKGISEFEATIRFIQLREGMVRVL